MCGGHWSMRSTCAGRISWLALSLSLNTSLMSPPQALGLASNIGRSWEVLWGPACDSASGLRSSCGLSSPSLRVVPWVPSMLCRWCTAPVVARCMVDCHVT